MRKFIFLACFISGVCGADVKHSTVTYKQLYDIDHKCRGSNHYTMPCAQAARKWCQGKTMNNVDTTAVIDGSNRTFKNSDGTRGYFEITCIWNSPSNTASQESETTPVVPIQPPLIQPPPTQPTQSPGTFAAIQIYKSNYSAGSSWNGSSRGAVTVTITANKPLFLFLSAYEPVSWNLGGDVDRVTGVYVHGYYKGIVTGVADEIVSDDNWYPDGNYRSEQEWCQGANGKGWCWGKALGNLALVIASQKGCVIHPDDIQGSHTASSFTIDTNDLNPTCSQ